MDIFADTSLKKHTNIYRFSDTEQDNITKNIPSWFCEDILECLKYANRNKIMSIYRLKKTPKLIDINHMVFHLDFLSCVNNKYPNLITDDNLNIKKLMITAPLGLPNTQSVIELEAKPECSYQSHEEQTEVLKSLKFFNNRSRLSVDKLDRNLVKFLQLEYGDTFDGYISKISVPSEFHCGIFDKEICLFEPLRFIVHVKDRNIQELTGGSTNRPQIQRAYRYEDPELIDDETAFERYKQNYIKNSNARFAKLNSITI